MLNYSNLKVIGGNNFSGRSDFLKRITKDTANKKNLYIGELPNNYLSGIASTVNDEIKLHQNKANSSLNLKIQEFFNQISFEENADKNPFDLSGGEQAILAIVTHLMLKPSNLALDSVLEQLSPDWAIKTIDLLRYSRDINTYISDNRISSYGVIPNKTLSNTCDLEIASSEFCLEKGFSDTILLKDIDFYYKKGRFVLKDLCWTLKPQSIYHLMGLNGAGKSTMAKLLTGVIKPKRGAFFVNGAKFDPYKTPGKACGYSYQNPDEQLFSKTVFSELNGDKNPEKARMLARTFGLDKLEKKHPMELPFVLRKRLSIAATLSQDCGWYIFDEPTLGQDDISSNQIASILYKLSQLGKGVIVISHNASFLATYNVKNVFLQAGKISNNV